MSFLNHLKLIFLKFISIDDSFKYLVEGRKTIDNFMNGLKLKLAKKLNIRGIYLDGYNEYEDLDCFDELADHLSDSCALPFHKHTYVTRHLKILTNACYFKSMVTNTQISDFKQIISEHCSQLNGLDKTIAIV